MAARCISEVSLSDLDDAFDQLPNEVVLHIFEYLKAKDLASVRQTCRRFHNLTEVDTVWQHLCQQEHGVTSLEGWGDSSTTFYDLYSKVLHPYGSCVGLWRNSSTPYGICIRVQLEEGQIVAQSLRYPKREDINIILEWSQPVFSVTLTEGIGRVACRKGCSNNACVKASEKELKFQCKRCYDWQHSFEDPDELFACWVTEMAIDMDGLNDPGPYQVFKEIGVAKVTDLWTKFEMQRIPPVVQSPVSPIHLGYYKGTYGSHGIEVIKLALAPDGFQILGDKILGDPNVPAGVISLFVDLRRPMTLREEQQQDLGSLKEVNAETLDEPFVFPSQAYQPFSLSPEIYNREVDENLPTRCKARFAGLGQIAAHGFREPDLTQGHFVVFSEDYFGFLWIDLSSFSIFRRIEDTFS